jgi:hypothetical protein
MIDVPNLVAGFVAGIITSLLFWIPDRVRAKREQYETALADWAVAAKSFELMFWAKGTAAADFYEKGRSYPLDRWRAILGPDQGFQLLEDVENALHGIEFWSGDDASQTIEMDASSREQNRAQAVATYRTARVQFANFSRRLQSDSYTKVIAAEERKQKRRDLRRHPIRTIKRLIQNRRIRKKYAPK